MSVHSGDGVQVGGVRDPAMDDQHFVVHQRRQRQPAENLLEQLQDLPAMHLEFYLEHISRKTGDFAVWIGTSSCFCSLFTFFQHHQIRSVFHILHVCSVATILQEVSQSINVAFPLKKTPKQTVLFEGFSHST